MDFEKQLPYILKENYDFYIWKNELIVDHVLGKPKLTLFPGTEHYSVLSIDAGYRWDGPTKALPTKSFMRGSLVHDALYDLMRSGLLPTSSRKAADQVMLGILKEDGMFIFRRLYVYLAVRLFAGYAAKPRFNIVI